MRSLTLIITDLYLDPDAASLGSLPPRMPGLEIVLARSGAPLIGDWRVWACQRAGMPLQAPLPVAALARCAQADWQAGEWWLASAVHLAADLDHIRLLRLGPQSIAPEEWEELISGFNALFATEGLSLEGVCGAEAFVSCQRHLEVQTVDPARVRSGDLLEQLPHGPDARLLRRVMTEVQMWLHAHALNVRRSARNLPIVNGLWLWGGGSVSGAGERAELPLLQTHDCFLRGLWRLQGGQVESPPSRWPSEFNAQSQETVIAIGSGEIDWSARRDWLAELDRDWFEPALEAVRRGRLERLQLHLNDRLYTLTRRQLLRFWRPQRHWLEALT